MKYGTNILDRSFELAETENTNDEGISEEQKKLYGELSKEDSSVEDISDKTDDESEDEEEAVLEVLDDEEEYEEAHLEILEDDEEKEVLEEKIQN